MTRTIYVPTEKGERMMFKVKSIFNGHVYTVYAASGTMFLIWNDGTEDEHWQWMDMDRFKPAEA